MFSQITHSVMQAQLLVSLLWVKGMEPEAREASLRPLALTHGLSHLSLIRTGGGITGALVKCEIVCFSFQFIKPHMRPLWLFPEQTLTDSHVNASVVRAEWTVHIVLYSSCDISVGAQMLYPQDALSWGGHTSPM